VAGATETVAYRLDGDGTARTNLVSAVGHIAPLLLHVETSDACGRPTLAVLLVLPLIVLHPRPSPEMSNPGWFGSVKAARWT
jgi:hypothetical protein